MCRLIVFTTFASCSLSVLKWIYDSPTLAEGREKTFLVVLRHLGHQENVRLLSDIFDISDSSVVMCRDRVINALLNNLLDRYISWPLNQNTQADIAAKFHEKNRFPGILGCIDGTHIKIKAPHEYSQSYVNRKGYHSVILQAICSHDMRFTSCFVG